MKPPAHHSRHEAVQRAPVTPTPAVAPAPIGVVHASKRRTDDMADRLALRLDEVADALGISRRSVERERSAGRFPRPDLTIGRMPLWRPETLREWIESRGKGVAR